MDWWKFIFTIHVRGYCLFGIMFLFWNSYTHAFVSDQQYQAAQLACDNNFVNFNSTACITALTVALSNVQDINVIDPKKDFWFTNVWRNEWSLTTFMTCASQLERSTICDLILLEKNLLVDLDWRIKFLVSIRLWKQTTWMYNLNLPKFSFDEHLLVSYLVCKQLFMQSQQHGLFATWIWINNMFLIFQFWLYIRLWWKIIEFSFIVVMWTGTIPLNNCRFISFEIVQWIIKELKRGLLLLI